MSSSTPPGLGFSARTLLACCCSCVCSGDARFPASCCSLDIWRTLAPPLLSSCPFLPFARPVAHSTIPRILFCIPHFEHLAPLLQRLFDVVPRHCVKYLVPHAPFLRRPARVIFSGGFSSRHLIDCLFWIGCLFFFTNKHTALLQRHRLSRLPHSGLHRGPGGVLSHLVAFNAQPGFQLQTLEFLVSILVSLDVL